MSTPNPSASEWRLGWRPLVAAFVGTGVSWNVTVILAGLFLRSMQSDLGWSRTALAFGPIAGILFTVLLPLVSVVVDRFGARATAIFGIIALSGAYLVFALIPPMRSAYFGAIAILSCAGVLCNSVVFSRGLAEWFDKRLATAIGIMMTGSAASAAIFTPWLGWLIERDGWRAGFAALGVGTLLIGLPVVVLWFRTKSSAAVRDSGTLAPPLPLASLCKRRDFWFLAFAIAAGAIPIGGFLQHLVPLLTDRGLSLEAAAGLGSVFALSIGAGAVLSGMLMDHFNQFRVCAASFVLAAAGVAFLGLASIEGSSWVKSALACAMIGASAGTMGDVVNVFSVRLFGTASFARVVAIMATIMSGGMALGGLIFAKAYDLTGSYEFAVYAGVASYVVAGVIVLAMDQPVTRRLPTSSREADLRAG